MRKLLVVLLMVFTTMACSGGGDSAKAYCDALNKQRLSTSSATEADVTAALDTLVALAPAEIKKEMEAIRSYNNLAVQAQTADANRSAEFSASIASADASTAGAFAKVSTFVTDKCGIDLGPSASSFSTTGNSIN